jgi:hypothetical protein
VEVNSSGRESRRGEPCRGETRQEERLTVERVAGEKDSPRRELLRWSQFRAL